VSGFLSFQKPRSPPVFITCLPFSSFLFGFGFFFFSAHPPTWFSNCSLSPCVPKPGRPPLTGKHSLPVPFLGEVVHLSVKRSLSSYFPGVFLLVMAEICSTGTLLSLRSNPVLAYRPLLDYVFSALGIPHVIHPPAWGLSTSRALPRLDVRGVRPNSWQGLFSFFSNPACLVLFRGSC